MTSPIDRTWSIRDATLRWLYVKTMAGNSFPVLSAADIAETVGWTSDPITDEEAHSATSWLRDKGMLDGQGVWGGGVPRPQITPAGERLADSGKSVRGGDEPAEPQGPSTTINISNSNVGNVASNSPGASQAASVNVLRAAEGVVQALRAAADEPSVPEAAAAQARETAVEIQAEIDSGTPNHGKLKELLFRTMTTIAGAVGSAVGTGLAQQAQEAIQAIGP